MPVAEDRCRVRGETSLVTITKRFMKLKNRCDGVVELNNAAAMLKVPKRRLYDVVNVLQGVGMMEKLRRNTFVWEEAFAEDSDVLKALHYECDVLLKEEASLDDMIQKLGAAVRDARNEAAYVHVRDLRSLEKLADQTLIGVSSLPEEVSSIAVRSSAETGKYEILIKSDNGTPLSGFLSPAYSDLFMDMMKFAYRNEDMSSPSVVVKQEEIEFENEMLDCILETLFNPSVQHNSVLKDGSVDGSAEQDTADFFKNIDGILSP